MANLRLPNNSTERFDIPGLPAGWSTSGDALWTTPDDPAHAYGTGRYAAKAGQIADGQSTNLRSPTTTVPAGGGTLSYSYWISSQFLADGLRLFTSLNGGAFEEFDQLPLAPQTFLSGAPGVTRFTDVAYPANLPSVIAVGASTDWDYRSMYSQYGVALDLVAPSSGGYGGGYTTDRTGEAGYNRTGVNDPGLDPLSDLDYTSTFSGTSFAAPVTAGVAALMLSKNPHLTAAQIASILKNSADKIGGNNGQTAYDASGFNQYYGYGRVNAAAALAATPADTIGPRVENIIVSNSNNIPAPYNFTTATYTPTGGQPQPVIGSGNQLRTVPVGGANTLEIKFSEAVDLAFDDLAVIGLRTGRSLLKDANNFFVDEATNTYKWTFLPEGNLPAWAADDQYAIVMEDSVTDLAGNALDGEWTNPRSIATTSALVSEFPSGDGQPGGDFEFVLTMLFGDRNLNNVVAFQSDIQPILVNVGVTGVVFTWSQGDFNGNGTVSTLGDVQPAQANVGKPALNSIVIAADWDGDFDVDSNDYGHDANGDGVYDGADLLIWQRQLGLMIVSVI